MMRSWREGVGRKVKEESVLAFIAPSLRLVLSSRSRLRHLITCGIPSRLVMSSRSSSRHRLVACLLIPFHPGSVSPVRLARASRPCVSPSDLLITRLVSHCLVSRPHCLTLSSLPLPPPSPLLRPIPCPCSFLVSRMKTPSATPGNHK